MHVRDSPSLLSVALSRSVAMPIYYALIARRQVVLCDYTDASGDFETLVPRFLQVRRLPLSSPVNVWPGGRPLANT